MSSQQERNALYLFHIASKFYLVLLVILLISGCSSSSSDGGGDSTSTVVTETVALGDSTKNVQLTADTAQQIVVSYTYPGDVTAKGDMSIDMNKTLGNVTLSSTAAAHNANIWETLWLLASGLVKDAFAAESAQVTVHISYKGDPDVCSSPYIGQDTIMGAIGSSLTGNMPTANLTQEAVDIMNFGAFDICVVTTPPIDAYATLTGVVVDFAVCEPATVDIVGSWSGTYQCTNFGTTDGGGPITLTISQNADGSYHYVNNEEAFDGHLCGNKFKFKGGVAGSYTESGTLVFEGNTATKSSTWQSTDLMEGGRCFDDLQKDAG